ncbi:MAG: hypothetical protein ABR95_06355 [Sphingobacteriales bacterium BACL12 MAG-120813-bin55]|nr:MAG: hypothetical protein ABR95_06355 [Sphingobacteriales bacterium BACL12 MAG-120813-bin55]
MMQESPLVLFDGVCNLCNGTVKTIVRMDRRAQFHFASLQSDYAQELFKSQQLLVVPESVVLFHNDQFYFKSSAVLAIAGLLGFPYNLLKVGTVIPVSWRDAIYDALARNRYRWFGRQDSCMVPDENLRKRFPEYGV